MRSLLLLVMMMGVAAAEPKVTFTGNETFTAAELRTAMQSVEDEEHFERGLLLISAFYWDQGYANVKVHEVAWATDKIAIALDEGPKFTMSAVRVKDRPELLDKLWLREGMTFSRTHIADDRELLSTFFQDQGYAYVNVLPMTKVDVEHATIELTYEIETGKKTRIGAVHVYNASVELVRRELGLAEGEMFNETRLEAGKARLIAKGLTDVVISTKHGAKPDTIDINIELPSSD
jgi:outer membrane protein insertion porin family